MALHESGKQDPRLRAVLDQVLAATEKLADRRTGIARKTIARRAGKGRLPVGDPFARVSRWGWVEVHRDYSDRWRLVVRHAAAERETSYRFDPSDAGQIRDVVGRAAKLLRRRRKDAALAVDRSEAEAARRRHDEEVADRIADGFGAERGWSGTREGSLASEHGAGTFHLCASTGRVSLDLSFADLTPGQARALLETFGAGPPPEADDED